MSIDNNQESVDLNTEIISEIISPVVSIKGPGQYLLKENNNEL